MIVGFTGTQEDMTDAQKQAFRELLSKVEISEFHHGDCIGADATAHLIAQRLGCRIHVHPPIISSKRAFCKGDYTHKEADYLDRNHRIVDCANWLIATPMETNEVLRSGTWATIRYARQRGVKVGIIWPDGTCDVYNGS